jgi:hypothetical protein
MRYQSAEKSAFPIVLSAASLLAGALAGGVQATPLSTAAAIQCLC